MKEAKKYKELTKEDREIFDKMNQTEMTMAILTCSKKKEEIGEAMRADQDLKNSRSEVRRIEENYKNQMIREFERIDYCIDRMRRLNGMD